jgi:hypothetical protein
MRNIKGFDGLYSIDEDGKVYSHISNKYLKPALNRNENRGLLFVVLVKEKKNHIKYIHKLVAENYLEHVPCGYEVVVDHIDNNKLNNNVNNLQLISNRLNLSKDKKNKTSKYTGVSWNKQKSKWVSQISIGMKKIYLGQFDCELSAYHAYTNKLRTI